MPRMSELLPFLGRFTRRSREKPYVLARLPTLANASEQGDGRLEVGDTRSVRTLEVSGGRARWTGAVVFSVEFAAPEKACLSGLYRAVDFQ